MPAIFKIPKQTDAQLIAALLRVRDAVKDLINFTICARIPHGSEECITPENTEPTKLLETILSLNSQICQGILMKTAKSVALSVNRRASDITDEVIFQDDWPNNEAGPHFAVLYSKVYAAAHRELKAIDAEAALNGAMDDPWNRYRASQSAVLNSLQNTAETFVQELAKHTTEMEKSRSERFAELEEKLRVETSAKREALEAEHHTKSADIEERAAALAEREALFNTKEARYVARKKQEDQIEQVKSWLNDWNLTKGTERKRWPIYILYSAGVIGTGILTWYSVKSNYELLKTADDVAKLVWWQWVAINVKAILPLAACITLLVYFIRWVSAWARLHADEEFRNRALLIDIGRSGWLLEAVRDAQEKEGGALPPELLKELSRNLFAYSASPESDILPQTFSDMVLQGLSSLRVKTPDGTEVEANRGAGARKSDKPDKK